MILKIKVFILKLITYKFNLKTMRRKTNIKFKSRILPEHFSACLEQITIHIALQCHATFVDVIFNFIFGTFDIIETWYNEAIQSLLMFKATCIDLTRHGVSMCLNFFEIVLAQIISWFYFKDFQCLQRQGRAKRMRSPMLFSVKICSALSCVLEQPRIPNSGTAS